MATAKLGLVLVALLAAGAAAAQAPQIRRTEIQRADVASGVQEAVLGTAEIVAGGDSGRHLHRGVEAFYVVEGVVELTLDGQAPRTLRAGEGFIVPREVVHHARAVGGPARLTATWIIDKGSPVAVPVN